MGEVDEELAELVALAREHVRWELDLGSRGLPDLIEEVRRAREAEPRDLPTAGPGEGSAGKGAPGSVRPQPKDARDTGPSGTGSPSDGIEAGDRALGTSSDRRARLALVAQEAAACTRCRLHAGRTKSVFARGNPDARLVFVGEGPGFNEDEQGLPFVGKAGQLLDKMIAAMGFSQDEVYICNVVKCRPPENRTPNPDEAAACMPFLRTQLEVIAPEVIVALGRCAAENLGVAREGQRWRGVWGSFEGVRVMPTYHPAYLLRNPEHKRPVWEDLQAVVAAMGRELPGRR